MDWYMISVLVFVAMLAVLVFMDRKNFKRDSFFLLRRTRKGKGLIIRLGTRFPRGWKLVGYVSVATGFAGSVIGLKMFLDLLLQAVTTKEVVAGLAVVGASPTSQTVIMPGVILVPFWYWIISIALLVIVHEGFHGIFTAREKVRIKSMGIGVLAVIPLAFVEPDEKQLEKKGVWPQLRVFSAGSFANFLLAGLVLLLLISPLFNVFGTTPVALMGYEAREVMISEITHVDNNTISSLNDLRNLNFSTDEIITVKTSGGTYLSRPGILKHELLKSNISVVLMLDYPAFRSNLSGRIIKIGDFDLGDIKDPDIYQRNLSLAMEKAGPGKTITIVTGNRTENRSYTLTTASKPYPEAYRPDSNVNIDIAIDSLIPGFWQFSENAGEIGENIGAYLSALSGQLVRINWEYTQRKVNFYRWLQENATSRNVKSYAKTRILYWEGEASKYQRPGYLGIISTPGAGGVVSSVSIKPELAGLEEPILFVSGLLFFIFLINLGVGIVNLLPAKPLDGGRMWDAVLKRYMPKHADIIMKFVARFILVVIIILFIAAIFPIGALL